MSVKRLILDTGQLDQDRIIGTGTVVLNSRATLDTNIIAGTGYDASLGYNSNINLYDGSSLIYDYADAPMGEMSATVQSIPTVKVIATAELGAISSIAQTGVAHSVQGAANLGLLTANANTLPTILPILNATLDGMSSSATAVVEKVAQAQSLLGSLNSIISAIPEVEVVAVSELGSLVANADAVIPNPPEPEQHYGSRYGYYQVQNKKKPEPVEIKPTIINYDFEPLEPLVKTIFATSQSNLFGLSTMAQSQIDFSTEQDDLDLLLII
jgi:hypothetical protein